MTPNVDHLAQLQDNPALREAYAKARLRLCDSRILQPLLQRLGVQIEEVIPGSDLTMDLLDWANREHLRIVLIGATEQECSKLRALYPGITVYHHNPPMGFINRPDEVQKALQFVREHPSNWCSTRWVHRARKYWPVRSKVTNGPEWALYRRVDFIRHRQY